MKYTVCSVICVKGDWFASCGVIRQGPYLSKDAAVQVATSEALAYRRRQLPAKISVHDGITGEVAVEYCLCANSKWQNN